MTGKKKETIRITREKTTKTIPTEPIQTSNRNDTKQRQIDSFLEESLKKIRRYVQEKF